MYIYIIYIYNWHSRHLRPDDAYIRKLTHLSPSAAYMRQSTRSALVQIMACRVVGAKPLSEPMLNYCQLASREQTSVKFESKYKIFHTRKCIWKCRPRNGGHFVQGGGVKCANTPVRWQAFAWTNKITKRHTAHTIVSWPNPKQWVIVHISDLMMIIRQSIYMRTYCQLDPRGQTPVKFRADSRFFVQPMRDGVTL